MGCADSYTEFDRQAEWNRLYDRLHSVTRVACEMEKLLTHAQKGKLSSEAKQWIKQHKIEDGKREIKEAEAKRRAAIKKRALGKLTEEEKLAIGAH